MLLIGFVRSKGDGSRGHVVENPKTSIVPFEPAQPAGEQAADAATGEGQGQPPSLGECQAGPNDHETRRKIVNRLSSGVVRSTSGHQVGPNAYPRSHGPRRLVARVGAQPSGRVRQTHGCG